MLSNNIWIYDLSLIFVESGEAVWVSMVKTGHVARIYLLETPTTSISLYQGTPAPHPPGLPSISAQVHTSTHTSSYYHPETRFSQETQAWKDKKAEACSLLTPSHARPSTAAGVLNLLSAVL